VTVGFLDLLLGGVGLFLLDVASGGVSPEIWVLFEGLGPGFGILADPLGVTMNVEVRRGGVLGMMRSRGTDRLSIGAARALFDDPGVEGRPWALAGFGVGVSGDLSAAFLFETGADTRREGIEGLGRLETLVLGWTNKAGDFEVSGGTGVALGDCIDTICGCFDGARILLAIGPLADLAGALMDRVNVVGSSDCVLVVIAVSATRGKGAFAVTRDM